MKNILIVMLGKGQAKLQNREKAEYNNAYYILPENENNIVETPFVGYAICKLMKPKQFDKIYILGTQDSMWDVLSLYCSEKRNLFENDFDINQQIAESVKKRQITEEDLAFVAQNFANIISAEVECQVIEIGKNIGEIQSIFNKVLSIPQESDKVSIDITHGLRFQPFLLLMAVIYLQSAKGIIIEHIFYGGLELNGEYPCFDEQGKRETIIFNGKLVPKGKTPIIELKPMLDYIDWINAANDFKRYGNVSTITSLLPNAGKLTEAAQMLTLSYQLNLTGEITNNARLFNSFIQQHLNLDVPFNEPFESIKETIIEFPKKLISCGNDWKTYMLLAKRNFDNQQFGLSILSSWEAVISRFEELYEVDHNFENYRIISSIVQHANFFKHFIGTPFENFTSQMSILSKFRNAIAHAEGEAKFTTKEVHREFPKILVFLEKNLGNHILNDIKNKIKYQKYSSCS